MGHVRMVCTVCMVCTVPPQPMECMAPYPTRGRPATSWPSVPRHDVFSNRMAIKVQRPAGSKPAQHAAERWSKPFSIEVIDTDGVLRVGGYELGIGIQAAPEPAVLTKVITFAPRYILRNRLRVGVAYRQHGTSEQACRYLGLQPPTPRVAASTASTAPGSRRAIWHPTRQ